MIGARGGLPGAAVPSRVAYVGDRDRVSRTRRLAVGVIRLTQQLPPGNATRVLAGQLLRSATSVAANYRAACRARSREEFIAKLGVVEEEGDETAFWFDLLVEARLASREAVAELLGEANQRTAIVVTSIKTAKANAKRKRTNGE